MTGNPDFPWLFIRVSQVGRQHEDPYQDITGWGSACLLGARCVISALITSKGLWTSKWRLKWLYSTPPESNLLTRQCVSPFFVLEGFQRPWGCKEKELISRRSESALCRPKLELSLIELFHWIESCANLRVATGSRDSDPTTGYQQTEKRNYLKSTYTCKDDDAALQKNLEVVRVVSSCSLYFCKILLAGSMIFVAQLRSIDRKFAVDGKRLSRKQQTSQISFWRSEELWRRVHRSDCVLNQVEPFYQINSAQHYQSHQFLPSSHSVFKLSSISIHLEFSSSCQVLSAILWGRGWEK